MKSAADGVLFPLNDQTEFWPDAPEAEHISFVCTFRVMPLCEVILKTKIMNFEKYTPKSFSNQLASVCKTSRTVWVSFSLENSTEKILSWG